MKNNIFYLLPLLLIFLSACAPNNLNSNPTPVIPVTGTFTGKFTVYNAHRKTGKIDSTSANLNLSLERATGFKVTGDTSTLHAGSYGSYASNQSLGEIEFADNTYPTNGSTPAKIHLSGVYNYVFDGTKLQIAVYSNSGDTVTYFYNMTKTGN